ncbi:fused response regulator/phosphatase [Cohnella sp. LGH]|uniref:PP2C family protein-serine/threonine phosphatase n=1 Tax=Cohnella sp. LGH TaxID=1619153 RepID=UPI001ADC56B2|nr:fused response regulator/phosphatase [Cohnella sp. LGH]QTH40250.1 fused response regulator/phosphatase [Cohnella sp. LGH]
MTVLIVDDNAMNVLVIEEMLKRAGYVDFQSAQSAEEMFALLAGEGDVNGNAPLLGRVDLILLDVMMPMMDGIEACRRLQADARYKDIPVIMVTAVGDSRKLAEALDAGASDFVTKPINKIELLARIRSALKLKRELDWHKERDARLREELLLARQVQESVLPDEVNDSRVRIRAYYQASEELAGDLYAWHRIDDNRWAIAVIDTMGHGISSSLMSMFIASILKEAIGTLWSPERVFKELNRRLTGLQWENELIHYYCTGIYATLDLERRRLDYINAGHPPGYLFSAKGERPEELSVSCPPLGLFDKLELASRSIPLSSEGELILFTDGIFGLFEGSDEARLAQLADYLQARGSEADLERLVRSAPSDGRSDDRCVVKAEIRLGGAPV